MSINIFEEREGRSLCVWLAGAGAWIHEQYTSMFQHVIRFLRVCLSHILHKFTRTWCAWGFDADLFVFPSHYSRVRKDIMNSLKMRDPCVTIGSFDRKNLFYGVKSFSRGALFVDELVGEVSKCVATAGSTIIYCTTIKDVQQVILPTSLSLVFIMFSHNHFCQHTIQIILFR